MQPFNVIAFAYLSWSLFPLNVELADNITYLENILNTFKKLFRVENNLAHILVLVLDILIPTAQPGNTWI